MTKQIDWEAIEGDYRSGMKTLREMAAEHGISHVAINKRAKRDGWDRDLSEKIRVKAEALVTRQLHGVTSLVTNERKLIEINAQHVATVDLAHRAGCVKSRATLEKLQEDFDKLSVKDPIDKRVSSFQKLVSAQESLYSMERKILNLDQPAPTSVTNLSMEVGFV